MKNLEDVQFIKIALHFNMLTHEQLNECVQIQRKFIQQNQHFPIAFILQKKNYITPSQITKIEFYAATSLQSAEKETVKVTQDRYQILGEIGKGGMGVVYKAMDKYLNREIAVKKLLSTQQEDIDRFLREARSMAQLDHPNIVRVYDVFQDDNNISFTMDFIDGKPFSHLVYDKQYSIKDLLSLFVKVGDAIYYAHRQGIIHRDLKPDNIMISKEMKPFVMDFGLARNMGESKLSTTGTIIGTPHYMSPEQAKGESVDERTDVYSMGVILYEILTKRVPFEGNGFHEVLLKVYLNDPTPPVQLAKVPPQLETICLKALEKEAGKRYPNIPALMDDVIRHLQGKNIQAQKPTVWEKLVRKLKRNSTFRIAFVSFVVAFVTLVVSIYSWGVWRTNKHISTTILQVDIMLAEIEKYEVLQEQVKVSEEVSIEIEQKIEKYLLKYMNARTLLEQSLATKDPRIIDYIYLIEKDIGLLALLTRNYILSELSFQRCLQIKNEKHTQELFLLLKEQKEALKTKQIENLHIIMQKVEEKPEIGMLDEYVTSIIKMHGEHIVKELLIYLKNSNDIWQQRIAIQSIGKIGNRSTTLDDKDVVEWLIFLAEQKNVVQDEQLAEDFIWAFGRLKDPRLHQTAYFIREYFGSTDPFFWRTEIPYNWIPMDKNRVSEKSQQSEEYFQELFWSAKQKIDKKNYREAIAEFSQILAIFQDIPSYIERASAYEALGELEKAMLDYNQGLEIAKEQMNAKIQANIYDHRAILWTKLSRPNEAIRDWNNAIRLEPNSFVYLSNRGFFLANNNQLLLALDDYNKALKIKPDYFPALTNRSFLLMEMKNWEMAIIDLEKIVLLNPGHAGMLVNLGHVYSESGNTKLAVENYLKALNLNPRITEAYNNLGYLYLKEKKMEKSLKYLNEGLSVDNKYPLLYTNRGKWYFESEMWHESIKDYTSAINLNSQESKDYKYRGLCFEKIRDYKKAIADWKKFIEIEKDPEEIKEVKEYLKKYLKK